ncbi:hypothetical protein [Rothia aeria]
MNIWNTIVNGIIENFSPIIAALIASIIAGISAYLTWKSYKNSHDATPPELLKYEKWLDIMKKRKEVLEDIPFINKDGFFKDREASFACTLELYERNVIWEGEVLGYVPESSIRKKLLKINPQNLFYEDGVTSRPVSLSNISKIFIILYFLTLATILAMRIIVFIVLINRPGFVTILEPGIIVNIIFVIFFINPYFLVKVSPSIADVYVTEIKRRMDQTYIKSLPATSTIICRSIYIALSPGAPFPKVSNSTSKIKFVTICIVAVIFTNSTIVGNMLILLDGISSLDFLINQDSYKNVSMHTYFSGDTFMILLSSCGAGILFFYTTLLMYNLYLSNNVLDKYELRSADSKWISKDKDIFLFVKDGTLKICKRENIKSCDSSSYLKKVLEFELSVHNIKRIIERKSIFINPLKLKDCKKLGRIIPVIGDSVKISFKKIEKEKYVMNLKINKNNPVELRRIK